MGFWFDKWGFFFFLRWERGGGVGVGGKMVNLVFKYWVRGVCGIVMWWKCFVGGDIYNLGIRMRDLGYNFSDEEGESGFGS